jgi:GH24 family phage-related lysozyme (muramidase)
LEVSCVDYTKATRPEIYEIISNNFEYIQSTGKYSQKKTLTYGDSEALKNFVCKTSNNFVLIEHEVPYRGSMQKPIKYYSLYMHLKPPQMLDLLWQMKLSRHNWYPKHPPKNNFAGEDTIVLVNKNNEVNTGDLIGCKGNIPYQPDTYHIEVFSTDERIVNMVDYFDKSWVDPYAIGYYSVLGTVACQESYVENGLRKTRDSAGLVRRDTISYFYYNKETGQVGFKKKEDYTTIYWVKNEDIIPIGYIPLDRIATLANNKIYHHTPLKWDGFIFAEDPGDDESLSTRDGKCNINALIRIVERANNSNTDNYISTGEIIAAVNNDSVYDELSKMIIYCESEWDGRTLKGKIEADLSGKKYGRKVIENYVNYLMSLQFIHKVDQLKNHKKFYYFHPWEFANNLREIEPAEPKIDGSSVKGSLSGQGIRLLKLFEDPLVTLPDGSTEQYIAYQRQRHSNGTVGLHTPGDYTITYGFGEVVYTDESETIKKPAITLAYRNDYPRMTLGDAGMRLCQVLEGVVSNKRTENQVNTKLYNRGMLATQNQFDALVLIEYNYGMGSLLDSIQRIENSNTTNTQEEIRNEIEGFATKGYDGLKARRKAEATVYLKGEYDEDFFYP